MRFINISKACEHNLKSISARIPREHFTVITGPSGSGKSTLAFDVLYNEANRKFLEALSLKSRQISSQIEKPHVESVTGISPAIAIEQKKLSGSIRSTVGTVTEIYNLLRVLFANQAQAHCPGCGRMISAAPLDRIISEIRSLPEGEKIQILAPVVKKRRGNFRGVLDSLIKKGYLRFEIDGNTYLAEDLPELAEEQAHDINVIVDRLVMNSGHKERLAEDTENSLALSGGYVLVRRPGKELFFSQKYSCPDCNLFFETPSLRLFSFNNPAGACPECRGTGKAMKFSGKRMLDMEKSLNEGAVLYFSSANGKWIMTWLGALAKFGDFTLDEPLKNLTAKQLDILLYGTGEKKVDFSYKSENFSVKQTRALEGIITQAQRRFKQTKSEFIRRQLEGFMEKTECGKCRGQRLNPWALSCLINQKSIADLSSLPVTGLYDFFSDQTLAAHEPSAKLLGEIRERLKSLIDIGLGYLSLDRSMPGLSGGEESRLRLSSQIDSGLTGVTYIIDEPTSGLHHNDAARLVESIKKIVQRENTALVIEHDPAVIRSADYILEMGEGAGQKGGSVVFQGFQKDFSSGTSLTARYVYGQQAQSLREKKQRRLPGKKFIKLSGAEENNLKNISVSIPQNLFTVICGVSGSGKSTLVDQILYPALANKIMGAKKDTGKFKKVEALGIRTVYYVDQDPIGASARSSPATFIGAFDDIRQIFSSLGEAKLRGYSKNRFSYNSREGRCDKCRGLGTLRIEMHFMPDMHIVCDNCGGKKYKSEVLEVKLRGKNISDVLEMTFGEAENFFSAWPRLAEKLTLMNRAGLDYLTLGQSGLTLSGGEAQRLKIALELGKFSSGSTLYILDEPTSGLHPADIARLLDLLESLTEKNNTLLVIEHNLAVINRADYIIELGPQGGEKGGYVLFEGSADEFCRADTPTVRALADEKYIQQP